jgi:hypothetical protein
MASIHQEEATKKPIRRVLAKMTSMISIPSLIQMTR